MNTISYKHCVSQGVSKFSVSEAAINQFVFFSVHARACDVMFEEFISVAQKFPKSLERCTD